MVQLSEEVVEISHDVDVEDETVEPVEEEMDEEISCMSGCCSS